MRCNVRIATSAALCVVLICLIAAAAGAQYRYRVVDIGTLGGPHSKAHAINAAGKIVGEAMRADGSTHAFRTASYAAIDPLSDDLGTLGGADSQAYGINLAGQVVGSSTDSTGATQAFKYNSFSGMVGLGFLKEGMPSVLYAVDSSGYGVGEAMTTVTIGMNSTIAWRAVGTFLSSLTDLGTTEGMWTHAYSINDGGAIVGKGSPHGGFTYHAFQLSGTTYTDLGTLGGSQSFARRVNAGGIIVGGAQVASGAYHAFRHHGFMSDLGTLGGENSAAYGVSGSVQIVGYAQTASGAIHAFLWDSVNGMRDLNSLIDPASGFVLELAEDINDSGYIVGYGTVGGNSHAYLLKPDAQLNRLDIPVAVFCEETEVTGTVYLENPAPAGGTRVTLYQDGPEIATIPASVTVPEGDDSADFTIRGKTVPTMTATKVVAEYNGIKKTASIQVDPLLLDVSLTPPSVTNGATATGKVRLRYPAPAGGATVKLKSNIQDATVPATVVIAAGGGSATFDITTLPVDAMKKATITSTLHKASAMTTLTIKPLFESLTLDPPTTYAPISSHGIIKLNAVAPAGGVTVAMSSSNTGAATVPASMVIAAGSDTGTFEITVLPITALQSSTITATISGTTKSATLKIGFLLGSIAFMPNPVCGGEPAVGTVTIKMADPANPITVKLTSSDPTVPVPATVTIPAGSTSANFSVTTLNPAAFVKAIVTATLAGIAKTATVSVKPYKLIGFTIAPNKLPGGGAVTLTVTISCPAPTGGAVVSLASDNPTALTPPASITVPAGATSASADVTTTEVTMTTKVTVTASFKGVSIPRIVTLQP